MLAPWEILVPTHVMATLSPKRAGSERRASSGRARDLLRQHYGLGSVPTPSGKPNDPLDMGDTSNILPLLDLDLIVHGRLSSIRCSWVLPPDARDFDVVDIVKTTKLYLRR